MKKGFDSKELLKDFDILLKKYNITQGFFVARNYSENETTQMNIFAEYPENHLLPDYMIVLRELFQNTGINISNIKAVNAILHECNNSNVRLINPSLKYQIFLAEKQLSNTDKELLRQYRKLKQEAVLKHDFESASKYKKIEKSLLNIK